MGGRPPRPPPLARIITHTYNPLACSLFPNLLSHSLALSLLLSPAIFSLQVFWSRKRRSFFRNVRTTAHRPPRGRAAVLPNPLLCGGRSGERERERRAPPLRFVFPVKMGLLLLFRPARLVIFSCVLCKKGTCFLAPSSLGRRAFSVSSLQKKHSKTESVPISFSLQRGGDGAAALCEQAPPIK